MNHLVRKNLYRVVLFWGCLLLASQGFTQSAPMGTLSKQFKPGMYEYTIETDMSAMQGMPKGMKIPATTFTKCVSDKDIQEGRQFQQGNKPGAKPGDISCKMTDLKSNGSSGSYTQTCTSPKVTMQAEVAFQTSGDTTVMQTESKIQPAGGAAIKSKSTMTMKYLGACKA